MEETFFIKALKHAKRIVEEGQDCHLAIYILRDFDELKQLGLDELAWAHHREGWVSQKEARGFIEDIEKEMKEAQ